MKCSLGPLKLDTDLILAPMMDVTSPPFILLCKHYSNPGLGLYIVPMVFVNQIVAAPKTVRPYVEFIEKNRPGGLQICASGRSAEDIKKAIEILNGYQFDVLDINSGCPARHTCNSGGGASLLQPHRFKDLQTLVHTAIKTSNKPVSVKVRLGWDTKDNLKETVKMIEDEGAAYITVHGRTGKQCFSGNVDLESIKQVKEMVNLPVVGNGDVCDGESYLKMKELTKVDAVMIGRATMGYPNLFNRILTFNHNSSTALTNQPVDKIADNDSDFNDVKTSDLNNNNNSDINNDGFPPELTSDFKNKLSYVNSATEIRDYLEQLLTFTQTLGKFWDVDRTKAVELRRNCIWMLRGCFNGTFVRMKVGKMKEYSEIINYIRSDQFERDLTPKSQEIKN